jgi:hypothetical protein
MRIFPRACWLVLLSVLTMACKKRDEGMASDQDQPQHYATPEETVSKAKQAFISALQYNKELNLGIDSAAVARSTPGAPIRRVEVNFAKLLVADPAAGFDALAQGQRSTVVPLVTGDTVVTIVELSRDDQGWRVIGLAGKDIADDLSAILRAPGGIPPAEITLYDIPNLQTKVYRAKRSGGDVYFTSYENRFDIRKGVTAPVVITALKAGAVEFQAKYGEALKNQRLVR